MKRIHLLCNAHIDFCWQWDIEEGIAAAISTFRCAADFCAEYDALIFNHNESVIYEWIEQYEPELFSRITALIQQGKWKILGGWFLQPDCNLPSGESFVRQIQVGKAYFLSRFHTFTETSVNFDSFGHNRGLVQILAKAGFKNYIFCRPFEKDMHLEQDDFIWVGYDGSEINGFRSFGLYNSLSGTARKKVEEWIERFPEKETGCVLWGVGDHGGGPSRVDLDALAELMREQTSHQIFHSTAEAYFADIKTAGQNDYRVEHGLNHWGPGCYTAMIKIKQIHRNLENEYYFTEKILSHAALTCELPYPFEQLQEALKDLLSIEFHDILPGSAVRPVETTGLRKAYHALEILNNLKTRAFFALCSGQRKAVENEIPIIAYNPHPYPVEDVFSCEFMLANINTSGSFMNPVVYQEGTVLPSQCEKEDSNFPLDWRKRVVFRATLEPGTITRFDVRLEELESEVSQKGINFIDLVNRFLKPDSSADETDYMFDSPPKIPLGKPDVTIREENSSITVKTNRITAVVNTKTGLMDRYCVDGVEILKPGAFLPTVMADTADSWASFDHGFTESAGKFKLVSEERATQIAGTSIPLSPVRVVEDGAVRTVIEAVLEYRSSTVMLVYHIPKQGTEFELLVRMNWFEKDRLLKLNIPTTIQSGACFAQTSYGSEEMANDGMENYCQQWCGIMNEDIGFVAINEGSYGFSAQNGDLRLSLVRSPAYAAHPAPTPHILSPMDYRQIPRMDQGEYSSRFHFYAGCRGSLVNEIDRRAAVQNEKPFLLSFFPAGGGNVPRPLSILSGSSSVQMTVFKQAIDNDGWIVRLFEPTGRSQVVQLEIPALNIKQIVSIRPYEIMTLRLRKNQLECCGLLEENDET